MNPRDAAVLIATNNLDVGGGEVMLVAIGRALRDLGVQVTVVAPPVGPVSELARGAALPVVGPRATSRREWMATLRRWDARHRPEGSVLWCNGLVPALATAGHGNRIVHLHRRPEGLQRVAARFACMRSIAVLAPSQDMADDIRWARALPNWCPPVASGAKRGRGAQQRPLRVGFLGRLEPEKGVPVLAEAVGMLDAQRPGSVRLVLGGEARFASQGQRRAVEAALAPVDALVDRLGWVPKEEFFASVDLAVFPSVWPEPFGLVAAEALSARVPCIVSDAGALPEIVGTEHPWIVPAGDAGALADTIRSVLDAAPAERQRVVEAGRRRWAAHYSPTAGAHRLAVLLDDLGIAREPPPPNPPETS